MWRDDQRKRLVLDMADSRCVSHRAPLRTLLAARVHSNRAPFPFAESDPTTHHLDRRWVDAGTGLMMFENNCGRTTSPPALEPLRVGQVSIEHVAGECTMRTFIALVVIVYLVGVGVVLAPTFSAKWNTGTASDLFASIWAEFPSALSWPVTTYHRMMDASLPAKT